jgi:hypothetical protein
MFLCYHVKFAQMGKALMRKLMLLLAAVTVTATAAPAYIVKTLEQRAIYPRFSVAAQFESAKSLHASQFISSQLLEQRRTELAVIDSEFRIARSNAAQAKLALAGIAVNSAIVLIDAANARLDAGMSVTHALLYTAMTPPGPDRDYLDDHHCRPVFAGGRLGRQVADLGAGGIQHRLRPWIFDCVDAVCDSAAVQAGDVAGAPAMQSRIAVSPQAGLMP